MRTFFTGIKTARLLLDNDGKCYTAITQMLRWAYTDVHRSSRISSLYQLRENYVTLLHDSHERRARRFKPRTEPHESSRPAPENTPEYSVRTLDF